MEKKQRIFFVNSLKMKQKKKKLIELHNNSHPI